MKTKILIFILLLCLAPTLHAVTYNSVKVYTPTGEPVYLSLNGAPVTATYSNDAIVVSNGDQRIEYPAVEVVSIEFSTIEAGTTSVTLPAVHFNLAANSLSVTGLAPHSLANIFSPAGVLVATGYIDDSGTFAATDIPAGFYIFTSQSTTIKFSIK